MFIVQFFKKNWTVYFKSLSAREGLKNAYKMVKKIKVSKFDTCFYMHFFQGLLKNIVFRSVALVTDRTFILPCTLPYE